MATAKCGWCGTQTHVSEFSNGTRARDIAGLPDGLPIIQAAFRCDECHRLLIGSYVGPNSPSNLTIEGISDSTYMRAFWAVNSPGSWTPAFVEGQVFEDVPPHIAVAASEAYKGASIGNHMSAILMSRTVIEASAKEVGITERRLSLLGKIDALAEQSLIREDTKAAAHAIREFGNDMAHGDISIAVDAEDAEEVLVLMSEVLNELFQGPARVEAIRAKIAARREPRTTE